MDNQIQNLLNLGINLNKFYCIQVQSCDIVSYEVQLQGHVSASLMNDLKILGYEFDYFKEDNWFQCRKDKVKIVLTFKN
jgi:hypothetical protein